jgi:hypothetical protein
MLTTVPARSLTAMRPDGLERRLRQRLDALGPAPRAELLHVLILPDFERADRSASSGATPTEDRRDFIAVPPAKEQSPPLMPHRRGCRMKRQSAPSEEASGWGPSAQEP